MYSCLRQSFSLPKKLFFYKRNSSSKFFSVLSSMPNKSSVINYHANHMFFKTINKPKRIQYRYFSLNYLNSFFESIHTSEATKIAKYALIEISDITGLSWSFTIIAASAALKLFISFPCGIYQQYLVSKLDLTKVELEKAVEKIKEKKVKEAFRGQWTNEKLQSEFRKEIGQRWKILVVKNNCHPFKITILFFIQLPFWLLLTVTIKSLVLDACSKIKENPLDALQLKVGGPFWCSDLTVPDSKFILPIISTLCMLTNAELAVSSRKQTRYYKNFLKSKIMPIFFRAFAVVFFFISSASPAALSLFWATNGVFAFAMNLLLLSPRMRRIFKIPKTFSEVDKPYSYALNNFVKKWGNVFKRKK